MKGIPINHLQGFSQMVIGWDVGLEDFQIKRCRSKGSWIAEHERTLRSHQAEQTTHLQVRLSNYSRPPPRRPTNLAASIRLLPNQRFPQGSEFADASRSPTRSPAGRG